MKNFDLALITGIDIPVPELQMTLHQPTVSEIAQMGEKSFFISSQFLCLNKTAYIKDERLLNQVTNFQIFMRLLSEKNENLEEDLKSSMINLFSLLLPEFSVFFTPQSIIFKTEDNQTILIDDKNFEIFQEYLRPVLCNNAASGQQALNPKGKKAQAIADKIMEGRRKVAAEKKDDFKSPFARYLSVLAIGLQIPITQIVKFTIPQIYDQMERYGLYSAWDLDVRARMAGAKADKPLQDWTKDLKDNS